MGEDLKGTMTLRFTVLASGSTGNATIIQGGDRTVMIDAGLSAKRPDERMRRQGICGNHIDALLVTHEHSDHITGLGAFARKYDLPIYANEPTWGGLERHVGSISQEKRTVFQSGEELRFGSM